MKMYLFSMIVCLLLSAAGTLAANSHWTVNPHNYQYDMTAYVKVSVTHQGDYEVAAFCGEECRGVGKMLTANDGTQMFQLRIYSNATVDETISFHVYQKNTGTELIPDSQIAFEPLAVVGTPSEPLLLTVSIIQAGDVNGDSAVDTQDAIQIVRYYLGKNPAGFNASVADVNGDGNIDTQDAIQIIRTYLNK